MLGLDIVKMHARFDHSSFSHSADMVGAHQNSNGTHDLTTSLSLRAYHPRASTLPTYLPNLKSLSVPTTKIRKAIHNSENGMVWVWGS